MKNFFFAFVITLLTLVGMQSALGEFPGSFPSDLSDINYAPGNVTVADDGLAVADSLAKFLLFESNTDGYLSFRYPTSSTAGISWNEGTDGDGAQLRYTWTGTASSSLFRFEANAGGDILQLYADGDAVLGPGTRAQLEFNAGATNQGLIYRTNSDGTMTISGGTGGGSGGNTVYYAAGHASKPGDVEIRADTDAVIVYDDSADTITHNASTILAEDLRFTSSSASLTADDQSVSILNTSLVFLTSDDATATNRTFTLSTDGVAGQLVTLYWNDGTNQGELADTGTVLLAGSAGTIAFDDLGDNVTLLYDGTNWAEVSRTDVATP